MVLLSWDGEILEGTAGRHSEFPIHLESLRVRSVVNAVVHTHPPCPVAFATTGRPLLALSHEVCHFVPPDIARFGQTGDLIATAALGKDLAWYLNDRNAVLIPHHGMVTVGSDGVGPLQPPHTWSVRVRSRCSLAMMHGQVLMKKPCTSADAPRVT